MSIDAHPLAEPASEPLHYVADLRDIATAAPSLRTVRDPGTAARRLAAQARSRIRAVLDRRPEPPFVLLSGGVDSIFVAAMTVELGVAPHAITVVTEQGGNEEQHAAAAARALGIPHSVIQLSAADVVDLAGRAAGLLGVSELWEVTAAIPLLAAARVFGSAAPGSAVLTGSGADAILGGGRRLAHPVDSPEAVAALDRMIRKESAGNFTRHRLVPHFYPALLGDYADHLIHVFQTVGFWEIAETFAPAALFGTRRGQQADKLCLRIACRTLLPVSASGLAWTAKDPIQRSSGVLASLAGSARDFAAGLPGALTYSDPRTESYEAIATRLYLATLAGAGAESGSAG